MSAQEHLNKEGRFELKPLSKSGIDAALKKAERYRLLNDPIPAESICTDILIAEPGNREAAIGLLLSLTDQFGHHGVHDKLKQSLQIADSLNDPYDKLYYSGLIHERQGTTALNSGTMGSEYDAFEWLTDAMDLFEKAEEKRPEGDDSCLLRWNTCARIIMEHKLGPRPKDDFVPILE